MLDPRHALANEWLMQQLLVALHEANVLPMPDFLRSLKASEAFRRAGLGKEGNPYMQLHIDSIQQISDALQSRPPQ